MHIIYIFGPQCTGKTTIARAIMLELKNALESLSVSIFDQDDAYFLKYIKPLKDGEFNKVPNRIDADYLIIEALDEDDSISQRAAVLIDTNGTFDVSIKPTMNLLSWCILTGVRKARQLKGKASANRHFGEALAALKAGNKVSRAGWNGQGMFIVLMAALSLPPYNTQGTNRKVNDRTAKWIGEDKPLESQPYIAMWTADEKWQPGWVASQADLLGEDWIIHD